MRSLKIITKKIKHFYKYNFEDSDVYLEGALIYLIFK